MMHNLLIASSAVLYDCACIGAEYYWWLCWIWQIPLWYTAWRYPVSARSGYWWGVLVLSGHLFGVMSGMWQLADGPMLYRIIPPVTLIAMQSLWSSLWFFTTEYGIRLFKARAYSVRYVLWWFFTTWLYIIWMDRYCLWMFGVLEGYCLFMPILALVEHPYFLRPLLHIGMDGLLALQLSVGAAVVWCTLERSWRSYGVFCLVLVPWVVMYAIPLREDRKPPSWLPYIGVIRSQFGFHEGAAETLCHFQQHCLDLCVQYPSVCCIITPESTLYRTDIYNTWNALIQERRYTLLCSDEFRYIVGGFREECGLCYNTVWYGYRGDVIAFFDKQHALPLTERMPFLLNIPIIRHLYFANCAEISCGNKKRVVWGLLPSLFIVPYICSELFFARNPDDPYKDTPILALCNTIWAPRLNALMLRGARFKAILWQRDIIYISHGVSAVLMKEGKIWPLYTESSWCRA